MGEEMAGVGLSPAAEVVAMAEGWVRRQMGAGMPAAAALSTFKTVPTTAIELALLVFELSIV